MIKITRYSFTGPSGIETGFTNRIRHISFYPDGKDGDKMGTSVRFLTRCHSRQNPGAEFHTPPLRLLYYQSSKAFPLNCRKCARLRQYRISSCVWNRYCQAPGFWCAAHYQIAAGLFWQMPFVLYRSFCRCWRNRKHECHHTHLTDSRQPGRSCPLRFLLKLIPRSWIERTVLKDELFMKGLHFFAWVGLAGCPAQIIHGGMFFVTTERAPITAPSSIVMPGLINTPAATQT